MDFSMKQYIDDNCDPGAIPVYNPLIWKADDAGGATKTVDINAKNDNAIFIIIHYLAFSLPGAATSLFFDSRYATPILRLPNTASTISTIVTFSYIVKGNRFKMTATAGASGPSFSLCYQTVTQIRKDYNIKPVTEEIHQ